MRRGVHILVFLAAFAGALAAMMPMRAALEWAGASAQGFSAQEVTGTVWIGRLRSASFRGAPLGDVAVRLDPLSVLRGSPTLRIESQRGEFAIEGW